MFECVESQIDDMMKEMPDSLKIPSSHLTLATTSIGQGTILILNTRSGHTIFAAACFRDVT